MSTVEVVPRSASGTKPPVTIEVTRVPPSHAVHFRPFSLLRKNGFQETGFAPVETSVGFGNGRKSWGREGGSVNIEGEKGGYG